ncbi:MAG: transketolase [Burkholderiales bacterium PBB3]|nr:MAG: transketolase [Burkholderiales bacterium PBB3]
MSNALELECANAIRMLAVDAVQKANSGHPGMPMGMADIAAVLWRRHLQHNPNNPGWLNRDRFVLSNGHGSMLQYALLHLSGYDLSIEDLKQFRQMKSRTPGHPEVGVTPGVETSTGPLGQGLANAVGMALAEKVLAAQFNRDQFDIVNHHTYVFLGDGCLMEGISHEVCSLAGTWKLGKLIAFWDDNGISIDGHVQGWFTDNTAARFAAYGWQVIENVDGHNPDAIHQAILQARGDTTRPTLIACKTVIGKGAPNKSGSHECHGAPLGRSEVDAVRKELAWPYAPFEVPLNIYAAWDGKAHGAVLESQWTERWDLYQAAYPELAQELKRRNQGVLPSAFGERTSAAIAQVLQTAATIASRKASQNAIASLAPFLPELMGGSADLASSNLTLWPQATDVNTPAGGNYIYYGVREFGMAATMNGLILHGGFKVFGGTFLMFSEYARNALRMAALMRISPIYVFTHDSICLGEDGPTHQPVEQLATLRLMPNMDVWRPCDSLETQVAWTMALESADHPTCLVLSRQNLQFQAHTPDTEGHIRRGGYVLCKESKSVQVVLIATGSEVELAVNCCRALEEKGISARVVSMPSPFAFDRQPLAWRDSVLPPGIPRMSIEAGVTDYWRKYVGLEGLAIGVDTFGESAPVAELLSHFGLTVDCILKVIESLLNPARPS